ncbi:hypothetical protein [Celeribacter sp.]|uniref:hypothetical protein n=1 Tax=Celeribacter sp. TaxID=1890673 RepID=UPI003A920384
MADHGPVMVSIQLDLLKYIQRTLQVCSEDLEVHLNAEYPEAQRKEYPTYERRYQNDKAAIVDARYCLDQIKPLVDQ